MWKSGTGPGRGRPSAGRGGVAGEACPSWTSEGAEAWTRKEEGEEAVERKMSEEVEAFGSMRGEGGDAFVRKNGVEVEAFARWTGEVVGATGRMMGGGVGAYEER